MVVNSATKVMTQIFAVINNSEGDIDRNKLSIWKIVNDELVLLEG